MGQLSLRQAVEQALAHHPELAVADAEVQALGGASLQARARPNPELSFTQEGTKSPSRTTTVQINQPIELGGKRQARMTAAERAAELARADLSARRHAIAAAVVTAFFDVLTIQERLRLAEAALELSQRSSLATSQRVKAGKLSPVEETKAKVAEANVRIELAQARSESSAARARLASAMGSPLGPLVLEGRLDDLPPIQNYEGFQAQLDQSPALQRAEMEVRRRQALTAVENARRISDITVSLGAKRDQEQGRTQAVIGLSIPLPLFDRNEGNILEALKREDKARLELASTRMQLESEALQARERLSSARAEAQSLAADVVPGAQSAYDAATKGFELGKFSFLEALDAQRTLLQARSQYLKALAEAHRASAELHRILGTDALTSAR
ncbi:cobalt-zinc-cadmium efflux system outer membrane protein [Acidovorax delafieldii]|uniref:Cobalt-zinc-cadmium efflux system outer membrane protein n=1 Tax=Acidovorax delafieldii TaxID=47920 RepID=A0AAJ2BU31_ACIDE|nr:MULTISPECIES: TolC family protein [Acidovorax]AFU44879.1 cobalt-zinc-cadmium outer membrane resistance protein [Acidovorax sp. KKS102]MDR6768169.1 cobalt-zinc-cadmium efflux system outer membrane protein [Acidovorax delafieldii]MDR6837801.1 cobalt-zinc-cadmium efflux system outer membrane protein [Acidovorax delafieldii]MDR7367291.1 cobalt-zinc-cadmium efflux system outer membrane protein [Acidovorax delafieldii]